MFESLGIQGKLCLWKVLQSASGGDARLRGFHFKERPARAQQQFEDVESERLRLAAFVMQPKS